MSNETIMQGVGAAVLLLSTIVTYVVVPYIKARHDEKTRGAIAEAAGRVFPIVEVLPKLTPNKLDDELFQKLKPLLVEVQKVGDGMTSEQKREAAITLIADQLGWKKMKPKHEKIARAELAKHAAEKKMEPAVHGLLSVDLEPKLH